MPRPETLPQLSASLRAALNPDLACRPFVCDGSPFSADLALVAINPGVQVPFWDYWDDVFGFDRQAWIQAFYALPNARRKTTRRNIERLVQYLAPLRIVELNAYPYFTGTEAEITVAMQDPRVLDLMLEVVRPRGLLAFGREPVRLLADRLGLNPPEFGTVTRVSHSGRTVVFFAERHLSRGWGHAKLKQFALGVPSLLPNVA